MRQGGHVARSDGGFSISSQGPCSCSGNYCVAPGGFGNWVPATLMWSLLAPCRVPTVPVKNLTGSSPVNPALAGEDGAAAGCLVPMGNGLLGGGGGISPSRVVFWGNIWGLG